MATAPKLVPRQDLSKQEITREQLLNLLDVARYMGDKHDLDQLLQYVTAQVTKTLSCERATIFLLDEDKEEIWSRVILEGPKEIRFPKGEGIAGETIRTGKPILIEDAYSDSRFLSVIDEKSGFRTRDILCVPFRDSENKVFGCIQAVNKIRGHFIPIDTEFLLAFGAQAAVALHSAQLYEHNRTMIQELSETGRKLQQKVAQMELIQKLQNFSFETGSIEGLLDFSLREVVGAVGAEGGVVLIADHAKGEFRVEHVEGKKKDQIEGGTFALGAGLAGLVASARKPLIENDPANNKRHLGSPDGDPNFTVNCLIALPLVLRLEGRLPECYGVIELINHESGAFNREHQAFLEIIVAQIESMMARKILFERKQQADRLGTIGQLTSTIIHDFKNPLSIIRGMADLITLPNMAEEKRTHLAKTIVAQVDRCTNMTKEILEYSRGEKNYDIKPCPARSFAEDLAFTLKAESEREQITLKMDWAYDGDILIDQDKIKRVIFNLTSNAIEVMEPGGELVLSCEDLDDQRVTIRVADTGPGIPAHIKDTLFEAFVTHGKATGTGLGLSIVKEIVSLHGGAIYLDDSHPQKGACFVIELKKA